MRTTVEYYGVLRSIAGCRSEELTLAEGATVAEVVAAVSAAHPGIAGALRGVATAVDERLVARTEPVPPGAVVALLPPVSGG